MSTCGVELPHYCGKTTCDTNVSTGRDSEVFCNAPHPTTVYVEDLDKHVPKARCRRQSHDEGLHAAYTLGVIEPERWA